MKLYRLTVVITLSDNTIIRIGHTLSDGYAKICGDLLKRITPPPKIITLSPSHDKGEAGLRDEATRINKSCPIKSPRVILDMRGKMYSSVDFTTALEKWHNPTFIIGGAEGHHAEIINSTPHIISLGKMTMPHNMAYLLLIEQLYRAQCIKNGHPYHRD